MTTPRSPSSPAPRDRDAGPILRALTAGVYLPSAVFSVGAGAVQPVLVLAAVDVGASRSTAASTVGLLGVVGVLSAPVAGGAVAHLGGRRAMAVGTAMAVAAGAGVVAAMSLPRAVALPVFVVGVVLQGVAANLWALARQGYVADTVPAWARARALSVLGGMMRLGVLVGPTLGAGAIVLAGPRGPFAVAIVTACVALGLVLTRTPPTTALQLLHDEESPTAPTNPADTASTNGTPPAPAVPRDAAAVRGRVDVGATAVVAVAMTCLQLLRTNRNVLIPLWGIHLGLSSALVSVTFAAGALVDVAMFLPSGRWMDRYGRLAGILPALLVMGASLVVTIVWTSPIGFVVGTCLMGLGNGFGSGIVMTMGADLAPSGARERFLGWWQGIGSIGTAAGPFTVSATTAFLGLDSAMWATAALGVLGGLWAWAAVPRAYARAGMDMRGRRRPGPGMPR